jgi:hypothetical protein
MNVVHLTKMCVVLTGFSFMAATAARAATIVEQLDLDAGGANQATITVDDLGFVNCTGNCGGLSSTLSPTGAHGTLIVTGTLGQFTIGATGVGGLDAKAPTLQNFNQINASSTGAGTLIARFTDTDYCMGAGGCFGSNFLLGVSHTTDSQIQGSTIDFSAFGDTGNTIPAGTLIGSFMLTGISNGTSGNFANMLGGNGGSLSSLQVMNFSGVGTIQSNMSISTAAVVPEPSTLLLFGVGIGLVGISKIRRRKA